MANLRKSPVKDDAADTYYDGSRVQNIGLLTFNSYASSRIQMSV